MNSTATRRTYRSPLREQQAAATRDRIIDGLIRAMAGGIAEISMPAVAREAGVSVATVYRHFPNKQALFDSMPEYFARRIGSERFDVPGSLEELDAMVRRLFEGTERMDPTMRAAIDSPLGDQARRAQMPQRLRFIEAVVAAVAPKLEEPTRGRMARLILVLTSSGAQRMLSAAGRDAAGSAEDAMWAIRTVIEAEAAGT